MLNDKKTLRAFIVLSVLFIALIVNGIFTLGSANNNPTSAWSSRPISNEKSVESGETPTYEADYVVLQMNGKDADGKSIYQDESGSTNFYVWVNVGRINESDTKDGYGVITIRRSSSTPGSNNPSTSGTTAATIEIKKGVKSGDAEGDDYQFGWYGVQLTSHNNYWTISTKDNLEINEIVFTSASGEVMQVSLVGARELVPIGQDKNGNTIYQGVYKEAAELAENSTASRIINEQDMFKKYSSLAKKYNFTSAEASAVNAVLSFANNDEQFVDAASGVFGLELIWIGIGVFGVNTVGVRIIPYLFFMLTVGLLFALGRKLFNTDAGLMMAVAYVLLGLSVSVGSLGAVTSIAVFFSLLSVYFILSVYTGADKYYFTKTKHAFKVGPTALLAPVLLSALAFALAVNSSVYALFVLPAIIAAFVIGVLKVNRVHAFNAKKAEDEYEVARNEAQRKINVWGSLAAFIASFILFSVVLTLLFYGIVGSSYVGYYEAPNLISAIFANIGNAFAGKMSVNFLKWAIGGGSALIYQAGTNANNFNGIYLATNIAAQLVMVVSFVYATVAVILKALQAKKSPEVKKEFQGIILPYAVLAVGALCSWILFAFFGGATIAEYLFSCVFLVGFIPLAYNLLRNTNIVAFRIKGKDILACDLALCISIILSVLFFGIGYVLFAGINVNALAAKILFAWWLF